MVVIADCVSVGDGWYRDWKQGEDVTTTSLLGVSGEGRRQGMNGIASTFGEKARSS
jgi:hypothetical protein